ncbi:hypothetical protein P154DRAFT_525988 [Amniculicola lignicola CBS 123094]|uniref:F-box domain-containing protein n=1 Tax=Amniculicola lignicola CBS 123094 TaxID=1392246 RepID=A0A6A5W480_9PLEO|nr:hypothetical protein P154DRAFT_525988 [Amniculicola lignicola CBS 123094]
MSSIPTSCVPDAAPRANAPLTSTPNLGTLPTEIIIEILTSPSLTMFDILCCSALNRTWRSIIFTQNPIRKLLFLPAIADPTSTPKRAEPSYDGTRTLQEWGFMLECSGSEPTCIVFVYITTPVAKDEVIITHPILYSEDDLLNAKGNIPTLLAQDVGALLHWIRERQPKDSFWLDMFVVQPPVFEMMLEIAGPRGHGWVDLENNDGITIRHLMEKVSEESRKLSVTHKG